MDANPAGPAIDLRLISAEHRSLYHALYSSADVMRAIGAPMTTGAIDAQFERVLKHNLVVSPGHRAWAISAHGPAEQLGLVALLRDGAAAELGVMLLRPAWRRAIASAALRALLPHAFGELGLERIDASRPDDPHVAVIDRLLLPFGFRRSIGLRAGEVGWRLSARRWGAAGAARRVPR